MQSELSSNLPDVGPEKIRRLKRAEYDRLVDAGVFEGEHVELIRGVIVRMVPQGPEHADPIVVLTRLLILALGERAEVRVQMPVLAPEDSEPEPDLVVAPLGNPHAAHPSSAHLVIEVARTSQTYDRGTKAPLYAEMGVPEFWLVDVAAGVVEVHREPSAEGYARVEIVPRGGSLIVGAFPDVVVEVARILG